MRFMMTFVLMCIGVGAGCSGEKPSREEAAMTKKVMVSPLAGHWYQDSERALRDEIADLGKGMTVVRKKNVCAAVVLLGQTQRTLTSVELLGGGGGGRGKAISGVFSSRSSFSNSRFGRPTSTSAFSELMLNSGARASTTSSYRPADRGSNAPP